MPKSEATSCSLCHRERAVTRFEIDGSEYGLCSCCAFKFHTHQLADSLYLEETSTIHEDLNIPHVPVLLLKIEATKNLITGIMKDKYLKDCKSQWPKRTLRK